jgi:hypothetical protein
MAGAASALMHLSGMTGSALGLLLSLLAPLPPLAAGLGWGMSTALVAALAGSVMLALIAGPPAALPFIFTIAIPALILVHFSLLYRLRGAAALPENARDDAEASGGTEGRENEVEWYPAGRIILLAALIGGTISLLVLLMLGPDHEQYVKITGEQIGRFFEQAQKSGVMKKVTKEELDGFKGLIQSILPASTGFLWTILILLNLWLAGRAVRKSGLLMRDWPDISGMRFPAILSLALVLLALFAGKLPGMPGLVISGYAGALSAAFLLLGLAVIHYLTRPMAIRRFILLGVYVAIIVLGWGIPLVILFGFLDPLLDWRRKSEAA